MKHSILLIFVILIASILRLYSLSSYPVGFHIDEASLGYNGYSMLKTGKDEHGNKLPIYIDMFGDNRPSGYHYLTIVPIAIFGLNEFSTRLPGALFGILTIFSLYALVYQLNKNKHIALLCSALLAIAPWHVVSSRASAEAIVALFFIITGTACIVLSINSKRLMPLVAGCLLLMTSFQFYHTPRVFVPLLALCFAGIIWLKRSEYTLKYKTIGLICFFILGITSLLLVFYIKGGTGRFKQVSIFGFPETRLVMEEQFREDGIRGVSSTMARAFHNKVINYSLTFVSNYTDYFSGKFLFVEGGKPLWYKVPNMGLLYLINLPFIIAGFVYLVTQKNILLKLPLLWLLLAPLVASITTDDVPNIQRAMVLFPMFEIIAGFGLFQAVQSIKKRWKIYSVLVICGLFIYNFAYFLHQYFIHGSSHMTLYRFNGFKEMVLEVQKDYQRYDRIVITKNLGGIYPHVLFYAAYDPATYQQEGSPKDPDFGGFGKYIFTPQDCPSQQGADRISKVGKILYVDNGLCKISPLEEQKKIMREDGTVAFVIVYPKDTQSDNTYETIK